MANMIKVRNKAGRETHFNRETFMKIKVDKEGYRNGWKESNGTDDISGTKNNSGVPEELKTFKGNEKKYTEQELNSKIAEAVRKDRQARADQNAFRKSENKNEPINIRKSADDSESSELGNVDESKNVIDSEKKTVDPDATNNKSEYMLSAAGAKTKDGIDSSAKNVSGVKEKAESGLPDKKSGSGK